MWKPLLSRCQRYKAACPLTPPSKKSRTKLLSTCALTSAARRKEQLCKQGSVPSLPHEYIPGPVTPMIYNSTAKAWPGYLAAQSSVLLKTLRNCQGAAWVIEAKRFDVSCMCRRQSPSSISSLENSQWLGFGRLLNYSIDVTPIATALETKYRLVGMEQLHGRNPRHHIHRLSLNPACSWHNGLRIMADTRSHTLRRTE